MRNTWTIGKRIGVGFGVVLLALAVVGGWSFIGFSGITTNLASAVDCNVVQGEIKQREVDHLQWTKQLSDVLTSDQVTEVTVQTDPQKCAFGSWYYSDERRAAEALMPGIKQPLADIEAPHRRLHESAIAIAGVFKQADAELPAFLAEKEADHLAWINACMSLFTENLPELDVQTDAHQCALGQFLDGAWAARAAADDPELGRLLAALREPHEALHRSAIEIQETWRQRHPGLIDELRGRLEDHRMWTATVCRACATQDADFTVETDPTKCAFGAFLASERCAAWCDEFPALKEALDACRAPHDALHASAIKIKDALASGNGETATQVYTTETVPAMDGIVSNFHEAIAAEEVLVRSSWRKAPASRRRRWRRRSALEQMAAMTRTNAENAKARPTTSAARRGGGRPATRR
jgi:methyl-accepting chemotaxis protein